MKIVHFLNLDEYHSNGGILNKSFEKVRFWKSQKHDVELIVIYSTDAERKIIEQFGHCTLIKRVPQRFIGQFRLMRLFNATPQHERTLIEMIRRLKPDLVYHRTFEFSKFIMGMARDFTSIVEINGNEIGNLYSRALHFPKTLIRTARVFYIKNFSQPFFHAHKGFVFVTHELLRLYKQEFKYDDLEHKSVVIPNSIDIEKHSVRKQVQLDKGKVKLVFLGKPNLPWHGVATIIKLAERTANYLEFHLIGVENDMRHKPKNVFLYGYLSKEEYRTIISECHIGIGTLAIGTAGITEASPLKVREYVAAGLPVIIGYQDTSFINLGLPSWAMQLPNKEELILKEIDAIVNF
jgi:glycosyltransferase involved in cell wall biosynthesis